MEDKISLDITMLSSILRVNQIDIQILRENEQKNNFYKKLPKYSPLLLTIACNANKEFADEICLNAAIQLKNYINSYWDNNSNSDKINDGDYIVINEEDKKYLSSKIPDAVIYIIDNENIKILKQLNQCVKKICRYYFKEKIIEYNKDYINKVIACLNSKNLKQIYAGIILFYQLSKIFEFDSEEYQKIYNDELLKVNGYLLSSLYDCKDINNSIQAQFAYKILKIFFMSFQGAIPELFTQEKIFDQWINFIISVIKTPISENNININSNNRKNIFLKLKRVSYQTITRIIQRYSRYTNTNSEKYPFENMIKNKYITVFFDIYKIIFINCFNNQYFIDDYGKSCIYNFFSILMDNNKFAKMIISIFMNDKDNVLLNHIIKDCYMTYNDLELYSNDPKKYLAEKLEEINSILSKRYNACKLFSSLFSYKENKKGQPNYCKTLYQYFCNILMNDSNNLNIEKQNLTKYQEYHLIYNNINCCLKKESILYLLKNNRTIIMKYLKNDFEIFIEKIVFPELNSSCAFLREQACAFIKEFKNYKYTNNSLVESLTKSFSYLMQNDPILPVRFESAMALSSFMNQNNVKELLKGNILKLLEIYLKLMEETDLEEIMDSLQEIVKNFTEESKIYIVQLSEYLIKYFKKLVKNIHNNEEKENEIDDFSLINNIISTFSNFIHYFVNNKDIYPKIESYIDILIHFCLIEEPYDKLEEGINLLDEILTNCTILPKHIWKFFIPLIRTFICDDEEQIINDIEPEAYGSENIMGITKIICYYIYKDDGTFLSLTDEKGKQYLYYIIRYIREIINICDKNDEYADYIYIFDICNTLFDKYRNKVEIISEEILDNILLNIGKKNNFSNYLCFLLSTCFIYYPVKTLTFFQNKNKTKEMFMFWFLQIEKITSFKKLKYNLFGICSLISLEQKQQDKLVIDNIKLIIEKILKLIESINKKIEKEDEKAKKKEKNEGNDDEENEDDLDQDELFKRFIEGENISDDEDYEENEDEDDEMPLTDIDKQNPILVVKNTLDLVSKNHHELFQKILAFLGDNVQKLNNLFIKEEQKIKNSNQK